MTDEKKAFFDKKRRSIVLKTLRGGYLTPWIVLLVHFLLKDSRTRANSLDFIIWIALFILVVSAIILFFQEKHPKYIYAYSMDEKILTLFLITALGREIRVPISLDSISKVKYRKYYLWIYVPGEVREYYMNDILYGQGLLYQLNVEKI